MHAVILSHGVRKISADDLGVRHYKSGCRGGSSATYMLAKCLMRVAWDLCLWSSRRPLHRSFYHFPSRSQRLSDPINYNPSVFEDDDKDYADFERVTAAQLLSCKVPPRRVKMLVRDFIDDSLYNPHYGYFSKQAVIFSSKDPIDFHSVRDSRELESRISQCYGDYTSDARGPGRQVWHTPTELFKVDLLHRLMLSTADSCVKPPCAPSAVVRPGHRSMYTFRIYAQELSL